MNPEKKIIFNMNDSHRKKKGEMGAIDTEI